MVESNEISVGSDGRLQLPKAIRRRLGLAAGSRLLVDMPGDNEVTLRVAAGAPELVEKDGLLVLRGVSPADILSAENGEREARLNAVTGELRS
jgi:AbrB family looped-hinge helix DNA binding protein